jgi:hypothetical protein
MKLEKLIGQFQHYLKNYRSQQEKWIEDPDIRKISGGWRFNGK